MDAEDLLFTNTYINNPNLLETIDSKRNAEFRKFIEESNERDRVEKLERILKDVEIEDIDNDYNDIYNSNKFSKEIIEPLVNVKRYKREVVTYINIDSRDRQKLIYPNASHFKISLGRTYYNIKSIKLAKMEFPNTNAVINRTNNMVYWRNLNDILEDKYDTVTKNYPIYNIDIRIGSYDSSSLQTELEAKLGGVRRNDTNNFHYFIVTLDIETDVVQFISLSLRELGNNPVETLVGTGIIKVFASGHGFVDGQEIYVIGSKTVAGIPSDFINGPHVITVLNADEFFYETTINAAETNTGGGNTFKVGTYAPFQLLFGEYMNTIAPNIGYPLENSSQLIDVKLKDQSILYQLQITLNSTHMFDTGYINTPIVIEDTFTAVDGNRVITKILSKTSILVIYNTKIDVPIFTGTIKYTALIDSVPTLITQTIASIENFNIDSILISTYTPHNYDLGDIGKTITFYDTATTPLLDGDQTLDNVLSDTQFVILGSLLTGGEFVSSVSGDAGYIAIHDPIKTFTYKISGITFGNQTLVTLMDDHILKVGDRIQFYNLITTPSVLERDRGIFNVISVPSSNTFMIDFKTIDMDINSLDGAYIGTNILELIFPNHGFNYITSIVNNGGNDRLVTTILPHNLVIGSTVRLSMTNSVPSIDNTTTTYTITDVPSINTFVVQTAVTLVVPGTFGLIGIESNDFYIYGCNSVDNFSSDYINGTKFTIREIVDINTFRFDAVNSFSLTSMIGGGSSIYISSILHGFNGTQTNLKNSVVARSINLEGENYTFLVCPQLSTMRNTGSVKDIFARVTLDQSPGGVVFSFLSNPKTFNETPLDSLSELEFGVVNYDGSYYIFNDLDYSFVLEITEIIDTTDQFNINSRRGIIDSSMVSPTATIKSDNIPYQNHS